MSFVFKISYGFILMAGIALCGIANKSLAQAKTADTVDITHLKYTVEEAPDWTNLFVRSSGWFGADGIFALPSDGARSKGGSPQTSNMIIFSDSMIGEIKDHQLQPGSKMVHNTVAYIKGDDANSDAIKFYWDETGDHKPESLFIPSTPSSEKQDYYWLGDGFVNTELNNTYIFGYRMRTLRPGDDWSFSQMATNLIIIPKGSKPPFKDQRQIETPLMFKSEGKGNSGGYGAGIYLNTKQAGAPHPDGYVYVYGVRGWGGLIVSRVLPKDFENFSAWRFWDGKDWNTDIKKSAILTTGVSNELSVSSLPDGRYALVFEYGGMSAVVGMRIGASPVGPFGPVIKLFDSKEQLTNKHYMHYNAKAHPSLSKPGELLISYNQNSYDFLNQLKLNPNLYHPYFIRLKFQ